MRSNGPNASAEEAQLLPGCSRVPGVSGAPIDARAVHWSPAMGGNDLAKSASVMPLFVVHAKLGGCITGRRAKALSLALPLLLLVVVVVLVVLLVMELRMALEMELEPALVQSVREVSNVAGLGCAFLCGCISEGCCCVTKACCWVRALFSVDVDAGGDGELEEGGKHAGGAGTRGNANKGSVLKGWLFRVTDLLDLLAGAGLAASNASNSSNRLDSDIFGANCNVAID